MARLVNFSELDFTGNAVFLVGILVGWAILVARDSTVEHLLNHPRSEAEGYWFPRGNPSDDDEHKSRWQRFKDWCSRNKVYIGLGILATVGVLAAVVAYSSGSTPPSPPEVPPGNLGDAIPDWKQRAGLDRLEWTHSSLDFLKKSTVAQTCQSFLSNKNFFSPSVSVTSITGADILVKEGLFLKEMLTVLDYYKENPPAEQATLEQLEIITNFLRHDLHILDELDQFQFFNWGSMQKCLKTYGLYLANYDEAPIDFKTLVNFLTQSLTEGHHREPLEAFRKLSMDFLMQNLAKEINV